MLGTIKPVRALDRQSIRAMILLDVRINNAHDLGRFQLEHVMPRSVSSASLRQPTNVTLPRDLLRQARELDINLSQACERGLSAEIIAAREKRWLEENAEAFDDWNDHVEQHGLPLAAFRQF
jgi:antitoxin CcdA